MQNLKIDSTGVRFVIAGRKDSKGNDSFTVYFDDKSVRFRHLSSVLDFIDMNKDDFGFI